MQKEATILLCPPKYFQIIKPINVWMHKNRAQVNTNLAQRQWEALKNLLSQYLHIETIEAQQNLPDMVFTANAGLVYKDTVVLSDFYYQERKAEAVHFRKKFESLSFSILTIPSPYSFEGAGDALYDDYYNVLWSGYGYRSSFESYTFIKNSLNINTVALRLVNESFYHLDTCLCPLKGGFLLYYAAAFDSYSLGRIHEIVAPEHRIAVESEDAFTFACNAISIQKKVILNSCSPRLASLLTERKFNYTVLPLSEFIKSGGAAKCLTLRLDIPSLR